MSHNRLSIDKWVVHTRGFGSFVVARARPDSSQNVRTAVFTKVQPHSQSLNNISTDSKRSTKLQL